VTGLCPPDLARDRGFVRLAGNARRRLRPVRRVAAAVLAGAVLAGAVLAGATPALAAPAPAQRGVPDAPARITIDAKPIDAFHPGSADQRRFGTLDFIGGL